MAGNLATRVAEVLDREQAAIQKYSAQVDVASFGYQVRNVVQNGHIDLAKMLVGSEGTLGLVTEARFKLDPLPKAVGVVLLFFDRLDSAARAALDQQIASSRSTICSKDGSFFRCAMVAR